MIGTHRACLGTAIWLTGVCGLVPASGSEPLTTAQLLVDLARNHGLCLRGQQVPADVQQVRTLLEAAVRLDPAQAEAYVWLYEMAVLEGDAAATGNALTGLLAADPTHEGVFQLWLAAGLRAQQTVEKRAEWLEAVAAGRRPPALLAAVRVALARLDLERLDTGAARGHLDEALALEPANLDAAGLILQTLDERTPAAARLRATLRVLELNPLSVETAWQVGLLLDEQGLVEDAARFYAHAQVVHDAAAPSTPLAGPLLLDLARNRLAGGRPEEAIELARQATGDPTITAEAGMLLHYMLRRQGLTQEADEIQQQLAKRFAPLADPKGWPVNEVAQAAWFYCTLDPQPHLALPRATAARERAPDDRFVRRVLGWAQALSLKTDDALRTLEPIAAHDAYAAYMLAKLHLESGHAERAAQVVDRLTPKPTCGPAFDLLAQFAPQTTQATSQPGGAAPSRPQASADPEVRRALTEFRAEILRFHEDPSRFLEARVAVDNVSPGPGEPWWVTFALTNRSSFPITLGPQAMVNPVFLLSLKTEGDRTRSYPALMTVSVDPVRVLHPGQAVRVRRTVDVGPLRQVLRQTPQHMQSVTLDALLDAEKTGDGQWRASVGGQQVSPVHFNRIPAVTSREALAALLDALVTGPDTNRFRAIEVIAELLAEHQQAELKRLSYRPGAVPADRLRSAHLTLLESEAWEWRVRTLDALQIVGLDRETTTAVENCLDHSHWLVRLLALRVLARQGPAFAERAASVARNDSDELVRALAESYARQWSTPPAAETRKSKSPDAR